MSANPDCISLASAFPSLSLSAFLSKLSILRSARLIVLFNLYRKLGGLVKTSKPIPDLSALDALTTLDLADNSFTESIPDSVFKLKNLRYLKLNNNQLSGIPDSFQNLPELIELYGFNRSTSSVSG
ncbi:hypothetical protein HDU97_006768 [Phlyctochytrium planicorne]|nr:hypothetical protein HDU97_006768 [Phlyctochytrium planicorne]